MWKISGNGSAMGFVDHLGLRWLCFISASPSKLNDRYKKHFSIRQASGNPKKCNHNLLLIWLLILKNEPCGLP